MYIYYIGSDDIWYSESEYLAHHGVKGQKWGVRRYQNEDGSLTAAGQRKYSVKSAKQTVKMLNKLDRQTASLKTKSAIAKINAEKARQSGKDVRYKKLSSKISDINKAIKAGESVTKKIVSDSKKKGYTVNSIDKTRYTHIGRQILANSLAGPVGNIAVAALDVYRAKTYGYEAGAIVKGKKYTVLA